MPSPSTSLLIPPTTVRTKNDDEAYSSRDSFFFTRYAYPKGYMSADMTTTHKPKDKYPALSISFTFIKSMPIPATKTKIENTGSYAQT